MQTKLANRRAAQGVVAEIAIATLLGIATVHAARRQTQRMLADTYYRSDHFSFAKVGVLAFDPGSGIDYVGKPPGWDMKMRHRFAEHDYHKPSDVMKPYWNMDGAEQDCALFFGVGDRVANAPQMPVWKPGSEFKAIREKSLRSD